MREIVGYIFGMGLLVNALLFVIQALKIFRQRSAAGVSIFTFAGFSILQLTGAMHGYLQDDMYLLFGMTASFLACGTVTVLSLVYRNKINNLKDVQTV